jgi:hypothetical protein
MIYNKMFTVVYGEVNVNVLIIRISPGIILSRVKLL